MTHTFTKAHTKKVGDFYTPLLTIYDSHGFMIDVKTGKERYLLKQGALSEAKEMREIYMKGGK